MPELDRQMARLASWCAQRIDADPRAYFVPKIRGAAKPSSAERAEIKRTLELYKSHFKSALWTGFECSNPLLARSDLPLEQKRWDQDELAGFYHPGERRSQLALMRSDLGLENARIGLPNHLMVRGSSAIDWAPFDAIHRDMEQAGVKMSLDLLHFGLPDSFHDPEHPERSDFLNPEWPAHYVDFALDVVRRYPALDAITLINEPLITNNFSGGHWNEGVQGETAFIDRALLMASAAVTARDRIEAHLEETGQRKVFVHNESCEYASDDADFNRFRRFLTSDLILGADWLLKGDFKESPTFDWIRRVFSDRPEVPRARDRLARAAQSPAPRVR
jgi:hypothetical protein